MTARPFRVAPGVGETTRRAEVDGENIWVTGGLRVVELRASDGVQIGVFNPPDSTAGVAFDGANIWVTQQKFNSVTKM